MSIKTATRRLVIPAVFTLTSCIGSAADTRIVLWPKDATTSATGTGVAVASRGDTVTRITSVTVPTLTVYRATSPAGTSVPAVVICPGGAYKILATNIEGREIAAWLNSIGITAAVLQYHVPDDREHALQDAQRAIRLVRRNAADLGVDPARIGIMGFSAGGHLSARVCTEDAVGNYTAVDNADELSCRPDFAVLVYPAYLADKDRQLSRDVRVTSQTPPTFVVQTQDDTKFVAGSMAYAAALLAAGVPCEYHLFATGGHGYGLRKSAHAVSDWPRLCEAWLRERRIL
jgi:acetyl esterase/lipase